jgi:hypothetical protein
MTTLRASNAMSKQAIARVKDRIFFISHLTGVRTPQIFLIDVDNHDVICNDTYHVSTDE